MKNKKTKKGFSLIEVLVSLTILTLGIASISMLMLSNIKNSQEAKNQIVAMGLAQEGIEIVRNMKDNNLTFSTDVKNSDTSSDFFVEPSASFANMLTPAGGHVNDDANKRLGLDSNSMYKHYLSGDTPTKFYRKIVISISVVDSKNVSTVTSVVSWNSSAATEFPPSHDLAKCTIANSCAYLISIMQDKN